MNELDTQPNLNKLIETCTPYLNTGTPIDMLKFPKEFFNKDEIRKELGYTEKHDNSAPSWRYDEAFYYVPIPGNELHRLYDKIYRDYDMLYGVERSAADKAVSNARRMAIMEKGAPDNIRDMIALTEEWIGIVEERVENPGNKSYNPFSKKVVLPEQIKIRFILLISSMRSVIAETKKLPLSYSTEQALVIQLRAIYLSIEKDGTLMEQLRTTYPRLYRAFNRIGAVFLHRGSLINNDGKTNLFKSRRSHDFLRHLLQITAGGKRTSKRTKKQTRRRTIRKTVRKTVQKTVRR